MARAYQPEVSPGFKGDIVYELKHVTDGVRPPDHWTLHVDDGRASAEQRDGSAPVLRIRMALPDFDTRASMRTCFALEMFMPGAMLIESSSTNVLGSSRAPPR